jgi:hypothetical protein
VHWLFLQNECILAYWEKRLIDRSYALGDCPFVSPFWYRVHERFGIATAPGWLAFSATAVVLLRMRSLSTRLKVCLLGGLVVVSVISLYGRHPVTPSRRCERFARYSHCVATGHNVTQDEAA